MDWLSVTWIFFLAGLVAQGVALAWSWNVMRRKEPVPRARNTTVLTLVVLFAVAAIFIMQWVETLPLEQASWWALGIGTLDLGCLAYALWKFRAGAQGDAE